jgi:hypothetical protein
MLFFNTNFLFKKKKQIRKQLAIGLANKLPQDITTLVSEDINY